MKEPVNSNSLFWCLNDFDILLNSDWPIFPLLLVNDHILFITFLIAAWLTKTLSEDDLLLYVLLEGKVTQHHLFGLQYVIL